MGEQELSREDSSSSSRTRRPRRKSRRSAKKESPTLAFINRYRLELVGVVLLGLGIFLMTERMQIRGTLFSWLRQAASALGQLFWSIWGLVSSVSVSDLLGIVLVCVGAFLLAVRIRSRAIARHATLDESQKCPKCGSTLHRVHSSLGTRLISSLLYVRIRSYACRKCPSRASTWEAKGSAGKWQ